MMTPVFLNSVAVIHSRRKRSNSHLAAESVYQHFHRAIIQSKSKSCVVHFSKSPVIDFGKKAVEKIVAYVCFLTIIKLSACGKVFYS